MSHIINKSYLPPSGTVRGTLCAGVWRDLCQLITPADAPTASTLGMKLLQESLTLLGHRLSRLRLASKKTAYSMLCGEYASALGPFLCQLSTGMVCQWAEDIAMETGKVSQGMGVITKLIYCN